MNALAVLDWVFTGLLLILAIASVAAGRGLLRRNRLFGIRIRALMHSDSAWRAGHAAAILPSSLAFPAALACSLIGITVPGFQGGALFAFAAGVVWSALRAGRAAVRAEPQADR